MSVSLETWYSTSGTVEGKSDPRTNEEACMWKLSFAYHGPSNTLIIYTGLG